MSAKQLPNYLRLHRKRLGVSEREIAFLLGVRHGSQVSRYEHFRRIRSLRTALAYHAIFRTSKPEIFGGLFQKVEREVRKRAKGLLCKLEKAPHEPKNSRKLLWLRILSGEVATPPAS